MGRYLPVGLTVSEGIRHERGARGTHAKLKETTAAEVDMLAGASSSFLDFAEVGLLVPVRFVCAVVRDGIQPRSCRCSAGDETVGNADDGRGVHSAAELGEH